jgi:hypothetical protein
MASRRRILDMAIDSNPYVWLCFSARPKSQVSKARRFDEVQEASQSLKVVVTNKRRDFRNLSYT